MSEGGATADSYIGSLISLISKSEIRYEGVLYTVDTANSNIALQDVRSFGTEGRKKNGPQIPPSDKVYDYIIFRGSDIKDLQVKMSPPLRPTQSQQLHHDPAIISLRSQTSPMVPPPVVSTSSSSAATTPPDTTAAETPTDTKTYANNPSVFQSNVPPSYQPQGSWDMQQIPQANMYWAGYFRPQVGIPYFQQQSQLPFQPPPLMPPSYASQSQFPPPHQQTVATSISPSSSTITSSVQAEAVQMLLNTNDLVVALPKLTAPLLAEVSDVQNATSLTSAMERKVLNTVAEASIPQTSIAEESLNVATKGSQRVSLSASLSGDPGKEVDFISCSMTSEQKLPESTSTEPILPTASTSKAHSRVNEPLLPLPVNPLRHRQVTQVHGTSAYARRGRGRGRGEAMSMTHTQYIEDFNFTEMNEKFNKDEVWGELGKSNSRDKGEGEEDASELDYDHEEEGSYRTCVYVKDDFFDMLSSDSGQQNGKMKYSEQQKIDAETFGRGSVRSYGGRSNGYHHHGGGYRGRGYYGNRGDRNQGQGQNYSRRIYY